MYDTTVLCGRFQPFHKGHFYVVSEALKQSEQLILVVGGAGSPRSPRNPFSYEERKEIILDFIEYELGENVLDRIWVVGVNDHIYSDTNWMAEVQAKVSLALTSPQNKIALIGHSKDHTSYYLKMFPQWGSIEVPNYKDYSATQIRNELFRNTNFTRKNAFSSTYFRMLNLTASETINKIVQKDWLDEIYAEHRFILQHKEMWDKSPYPVIFQTVDAVVEAAGHILMIERRNIPGKGLWALPGGYLNVNEHLQDGMLRELDEETKIDLSRETLKRCITEHKRYDDPNRSERGRLITEAYHIELSAMDGKGNIRLPKIRQKALKHDEVDDAAKKRWIPLKEVKQMRDKIFEDHFSILEDMLGFSEEFVYGR